MCFFSFCLDRLGSQSLESSLIGKVIQNSAKEKSFYIAELGDEKFKAILGIIRLSKLKTAIILPG